MLGDGKNDYQQGHPSLQGRAMFIFATPNTPEAAFIQLDNPITKENDIITDVQKGYLIRCRADEPNKENRTGDYTQQQAAFRSGAQIISTDYYRPNARYITQPNQFKNYSCRFPNGDLASINPISATDKQGIGKVGE